MKNHKEFLDKIDKELNSLTQDELYDLLVDCGMKGLKKLPKQEKGEIIIITQNIQSIDNKED